MPETVEKNAREEVSATALPNSMLLVSASPHTHSGSSVHGIMRDVVIALLPACFAAIYYFRMQAVWLLVVCIGTCVAAEALCRVVMRRNQTIGDMSALITGILLALNLPPALPLWQAAIGSVFAIAIAKQAFGGLGYNPFNPALAARAFLLISFTATMTTWTASDWSDLGNIVTSASVSADAFATATPLGTAKAAVSAGSTSFVTWNSDIMWRMFLGSTNGCIGETSALALIIGGMYMLARRVISWRVPVAYIGTVAIIAWIIYAVKPETAMPPMAHLLSGGLMIGAIFMATDMVTTPVTRLGLIVFGVGCGVITMALRCVPDGAYPEGVSFAILIMNAFTPLINKATKPRRFGARKPAALQ